MKMAKKTKSMMEGSVHWVCSLGIFMDPDQGQERHQLRDTRTRLPMVSTASIHLSFLNLRNYNVSNSPFY